MGDKAPAGWTEVELGVIAEAVMGQSPPGKTVHAWDGEPREDVGLPFIQGNAEFGGKFPQPAKWCVAPAKVAQPGDTLISVRAPVGETNRADRLLAIGRGLAAIRFTNADPAFGWHVLNHAKAAFERVAQGSTFDAIGGREIRALPLLLPPPSEQRAIAAVLDAIDDAIERAEAVIAATERLREALLHELLTRGVPGWHHEWKQVPGLGTVPACWDVVRLGDVCDVTSGFAMGPHRAPHDHPRPYLTVVNVQANRVTVGEPRFMELTDDEYAARSLRAGDVVLVEGHAQISQLGRAAIVPPEAGGFTFQNHLFRVRPRRGCEAVFVCTFVNGPRGRAYFASFGGTTSGLNTVSAANVRALPLPFPSAEEQKLISSTLADADAMLRRQQVALASLQGLKSATTEALLTGHVRVPLTIEVPA